MANNPFERDRFNYGEVAGDGKGDFLHTHGVKAERMATILFGWLSGGKSEVRLLDALPVERGGTGGTNANEAKLKLGIYTDPNYNLVYGINGVDLYDTRVIDNTGTLRPSFSKLSVGKYKLTNITAHAIYGFKFILPEDELGNKLCGCTISFENNEALIDVYAIKYESGKAVLDTSKPMDIPTGRYISISVRG